MFPEPFQSFIPKTVKHPNSSRGQTGGRVGVNYELALTQDIEAGIKELLVINAELLVLARNQRRSTRRPARPPS